MGVVWRLCGQIARKSVASISGVTKYSDHGNVRELNDIWESQARASVAIDLVFVN